MGASPVNTVQLQALLDQGDDAAYDMTKRLHREEGLIVGPSTGAVAHGINQLDGNGGVVVGISPDSGTKYTSYFADVLGDEGQPQI